MIPHLELHGVLDRDGIIQGNCVWCLGETDSVFRAEALGQDLPLHALCAARLIRAYERIVSGQVLAPGEGEKVWRVLVPPAPALPEPPGVPVPWIDWAISSLQGRLQENLHLPPGVEVQVVLREVIGRGSRERDE